jgi:hypothetical protein
MNEPIIIPAEVAGRIDPAFVREYLLARGWELIHQEINEWVFLRNGWNVQFVCNPEAGEYADCAIETIRGIAAVENRPLFDVVRDLDPVEQKRAAVVEAAMAVYASYSPSVSEDDHNTAETAFEAAIVDLIAFEKGLTDGR